MTLPGWFVRAAWVVVAVVAAVSAEAGAKTGSLIDAVKGRDLREVRVQIERHANVNLRAADGTTALHWAAHLDDLQSLRLLLRAGAAVNVANRYGVTPLMLAATNGSQSAVDALLQGGADANATLPEGETVLMTTARTGVAGIVQALVARGANVNARENWLGETALMWAAAEDHTEAVRVLIEHGADLDVHSAPTHYPRPVGGQTLLPRGGFTALMYAARQNSLDTARALASAGAGLDEADADGVTALQLAIINAHFDTASLLIEYGADPNRADITGMTPLYAAVDMNTLQFMHGRPPTKPSGRLTAVDVARMLIEYGAVVDAPLKTPILQRHNTAGNRFLGEGTTPLMRAAKSGDVVLMKMLLAAGANPRLKQKNSNTILMLAAGYGRKFDTNADALEYETATEADLLAGTTACLELGLDLNAQNDAGDTAMHMAAGESIVRALAKHGARLDIKNKEGKTPYDVAILRKDRSGRQYLPGTLIAFRDLKAPTSVALDAKASDQPSVNINVGEEDH